MCIGRWLRVEEGELGEIGSEFLGDDGLGEGFWALGIILLLWGEFWVGCGLVDRVILL